jgi:hypothetical protein
MSAARNFTAGKHIDPAFKRFADFGTSKPRIGLFALQNEPQSTIYGRRSAKKGESKNASAARFHGATSLSTGRQPRRLRPFATRAGGLIF